MDLGLMLGDHPTSLSEREHFDAILRQVEAGQRAGVTCFVIGQHFLWPGGSRWLQPVPVLARLAGEIDRDTRLATQIIVSPLYHPVMLAAELATLDVVTEGRLDVGLGLGYLTKEFETLGVPYEERIERFEEGLELIRRLWTNDRVDFDGRFYRVADATVDVRPVQTPHPPIWLGAQTKAGIRRAARCGDTWPITPQVAAEELPARVKVFADERERLGKPLGRLPLRREIVVGRDRADATAKAVAMAQPWYLQMARMGTREVDPAEVVAGMRDVVERSFVLGSAADCAAQLRAIGDHVPINPVITRGNWPEMSAADMVAYVEELGRELIPAMRDYTSSATLTVSEQAA